MRHQWRLALPAKPESGLQWREVRERGRRRRAEGRQGAARDEAFEGQQLIYRVER
jgi:hypothetical protein